MRSACIVAALAGLAYAAPKPAPQDMNFDEIDVSLFPSQSSQLWLIPNSLPMFRL